MSDLIERITAESEKLRGAVTDFADLTDKQIRALRGDPLKQYILWFANERLAPLVVPYSAKHALALRACTELKDVRDHARAAAVRATANADAADAAAYAATAAAYAADAAAYAVRATARAAAYAAAYAAADAADAAAAAAAEN